MRIPSRKVFYVGNAKRRRTAAGRGRGRTSPADRGRDQRLRGAARRSEAGFRAIYLSGAGVANASFGLPDLGMTSLNDVCEDVRRITGVCALPLLVDADTGWGGAFNIARTCSELIRAGAAGMHLEDQVAAKRCGHRPGKELVPQEEMCDRIKAAVDGRTEAEFVIMARTDAHAVEGQQAALERAAGLRRGRCRHDLRRGPHDPGGVPQFTGARARAGARQHHRVRPDAAVHAPRSWALRACGWCCIRCRPSAPSPRRRSCTYQALRRDGTQKSVAAPPCRPAPSCTTVLGYQAYETKLDELFGKDKP